MCAESVCPPQLLVTDLDGTLLPLPGCDQQILDLQVLTDLLAQHRLSLVYATGRHPASVMQAMEQFRLPEPDGIFCDVGTTLLRRTSSGPFQVCPEWAQLQKRTVAAMTGDMLRRRLRQISGLDLQEDVKQGDFKISFYTDANQLADTRNLIAAELRKLRAPWSVVASIDPFNGDGLIDVLPEGISKAAALNWWIQQHRFPTEAVIYAGDSGNDLAAIQVAYRAILVGNALPEVRLQARELRRQGNSGGQLFEAQAHATSGVLEGVLSFLDHTPS
ncbi:MAG: HAD-IIB family hydrolase [Planctomycetaceae bacterium]